MEPSLPVMQLEDFEMQLKRFPKKEREKIIYQLKHIDKNDVVRIPYLKGDLKFIKKYRIGDNRVFLAYCSECYNKYRERINCSICDKDQLERIVVFSINSRKKLYKRMKK